MCKDCTNVQILNQKGEIMVTYLRAAMLPLNACKMLPKTKNLTSLIVFLVMEMLFVMNLVFIALHVYNTMKRAGSVLNELAVPTIIASDIFFVVYLTSFSYINSSLIYQNLERLADYRGIVKPSTVEQLDKRINIIITTVMVFVLISYVYYVYRFLDMCPDKGNFEKNALMTLVPIDIFYTPMCQLASVVTFTVAMLILSFGFLAGSLNTFMSDFYTNRVMCLHNMIQRIPGVGRPGRRKYVIQCIEYYNLLVEIREGYRSQAQSISSVYYPLVQISVIIGCFKLVQGYDMVACYSTCIQIIPLILCSAAGDHCKEKSEQLATTVFHSIPWDGDVALQKDMLFMMMRFQVPLTNPVGAYTNDTWSLALALRIFQLGYSIISLLLDYE